MLFAEIQKKISDSYQDPKASVAEYVLVAKALGEDDGKNMFPPYVRTLTCAFLASFTIQGLPEVCAARGIFHNLRMETYLAPYNQFTQEAINTESGLVRYDPQIVFVAVDAFDVMDANHLKTVARGLLDHTRAKIIFLNFVASPQVSPERVDELNTALADIEKNNSRVLVFDFAKFVNRIGSREHWYTKYKELGDLRLAPDAFVPLSEELMKYAVAMAGNTKKCLVLDLDNTLWKGIVGEDGITGIIPDKKLQEHILTLYEKGVILAVNSKNNDTDAREVFERHPDMILKEHHIAAWRANWQGKERNIAEIAQELDLGTDSFVFVDDSGFEQERVRSAFPEVAILPPELLANFAGFHSFKITQEDMRRGAMYVEERKRKEFHGSLPSEDEFLAALGLSLTIRKCLEGDVARASQLTQKTNQFNLSTRRYTEDDIRLRLTQDSWHVWIAEAKDRFGDYGIIGMAMVESKEDSWRIDNFLLSCRILGRKIEDVFVQSIVDDARKNAVSRVVGEFIPTSKNKQCEHFYRKNGFMVIDGNEKVTMYNCAPSNHAYSYPSCINIIFV